MSDTPETDAARLCGYGYFSGALVPVERKCYEKDPDGDVVFYEVAEKLERERDEAREELARVRKELVASNRGAETNAKVNQGLCAKLAEAERERDEARRELARVRKELVASKKVSQGLCARLTEAERERDEARREMNELRKNYLALAEEWKKSVFRLARERDEARRERDEAKSIISRLVSRRIISWGDVDSVLEAINEEEEEA